MKNRVIVAGGGIAGISAALSAVRNGAEVILIEKQCVPGGLATSGLIAIYLPLCDGEGHQMSFGIAEELAQLAASYDRHMIPQAWREQRELSKMIQTRYTFEFNPQMLMLLTDEQLTREGVRILYDTRVCDVIMEERRIRAVAVENVSGRQYLFADTFVDASGDAVLFDRAGAKTRIFPEGNRVAAWYQYVDGQGVHLRILGECDSVEQEREDGAVRLADERFTGVDAWENSRMLSLSHKRTLEDIRKRRETDARYLPVSLAMMPQLRMTRAFCGIQTLSERDTDRYVEDSIGMIGDWRKRGMRYEIPLGSLVSEKIDNLIGAGRCISVEDGMWDVTRVIPACAVTGQAAGLAAAISRNMRQIDTDVLQAQLRRQGQRIHLSELLT